MPSRLTLAVPLAVLSAGLAAPASAQAPGLVEGVSKLRTNGIGAVKTGMTIREARAAAGVHLERERVGDCVYLVDGPPNTGQGPTLRFHNGKLRAVDVARKGFRTRRGVQYGDRTRKVRRLYKRLSSRGNLGGGRDLIWKRGKGRLIFSVAQGRVYRITGGRTPWVLQQECV
ncbi:MAG TPA: hypothetical protein VNO82_17505 [Solirubrobacteraceae bacterium]|nr:hypothetical protein [Solirubrobacteraceae bacterium]